MLTNLSETSISLMQTQTCRAHSLLNLFNIESYIPIACIDVIYVLHLARTKLRINPWGHHFPHRALTAQRQYPLWRWWCSEWSWWQESWIFYWSRWLCVGKQDTLMKTTLPCKTLFKTLRSLVIWINETGHYFWNWESWELPNTYCNAFLYIPGFKIKLNACELIKVFCEKKKRGSNEKSGLISS